MSILYLALQCIGSKTGISQARRAKDVFRPLGDFGKNNHLEIMKSIKQQFIVAFALLVLSVLQSFGVVDQAIQVDGTNLVLSWPSFGDEQYLIQYRPTLDPSTPWVDLANAYPANSTNRTTFIVPCCVPTALGGEGGAAAFSSGNPALGAVALDPMNEVAIGADTTELMAMPPDGSADAVPLALYPPGMDTNGLIIFEALKLEAQDEGVSISGAESFGSEGGDPLSLTSGGCDCPDMGFFRVFHIPDWSFDVTAYTYAGPTFFPVDFKDYMDRMENIEVLLNGEASPHAEFTSYVSAGQTNWGMGIYFDRLTNGSYLIQLRTTLGLNEETGENAVSLVLSNLTRSIAVFNQVTFPDWDDFIQGDTYTYKAFTANPNTDWQIDIYDVWGSYVNTGSGHTTNGQIAWTWDLNDWQGYNRDDFDGDPYFFAEITIETAGNGPMTTMPMPTPVKGYPDRGEWLISFQDRWYSDLWGYPGDLQGKYEEAIDLIWGGPLLIGDNAIPIVLKFGTNGYTQAEREQTWSNLLDWTGDLHMRNFYYHGHGGATSIGCDRHIITTNGLATGGVFQHRGSKSQMQNWQIAKKTKYNRYRFVFLDGCSTATGDLPNAFNISKQTNNVAFYENHQKHPRPAVFVGWNQTVGGDPTWGSAYNRLTFQGFWMGRWANTSPMPSIVDAIDVANQAAGWITPQKLWGALRIYGYQQMTIRDYNRKGDWRWP
jgi:hypothetical protein